MSNLTTKDLFRKEDIQKRFEQLLGKKAQGFISSVLQTVGNNKLLATASPETILNAAATAAALDLPINQNLGFAWIVPYKGKAQFQMGWKGFVQLALRTGQYKQINVIEVYENQFKSFNSLTEELDCDFLKEGEGDVVGYAGYFELVNGMKKTVYWTKESVTKHAKKYSQAFKFGPWKDNFDAMAKKTVLKNMLSKWGIMSIEMQTAQLSDQSVQESDSRYDYVDNTIDVDAISQEEEDKRITTFINKTENKEDLNMLTDSLDDEQKERLTETIETQETKLNDVQ